MAQHDNRQQDLHVDSAPAADHLGAIIAAARTAHCRSDASTGTARQFVVAIVPAHNEQGRIQTCLTSLRRQSQPADVVVVVAAGMVLLLPLVALNAAWMAVAVFVLVGFSLTLLRLVPLPMT